MRFDDHDLAEYARPRHNAVSREELIGNVGLSGTGIRRRCQRGTLHHVAAEAYVVGSGALSFQGRARIAAIRGGRGAGVHMEATLAMLGVIPYEPRVIDVLTPHRRSREPGRRFHTTSIEQCCVPFEIDFVPTMSAEVAIRGLAAVKSPRRLAKLLREATYHDVLDLTELRRVVELMKHAPGHRAMVDALSAFDVGNNGSWSGVEELGYEVLHDVVPDEVPIQNEYLVIDGEEVFPDLRWRACGVSVEFDGPPHLRVNVLADDADKERLLRAMGDLVIRIPWFDLTRRRAEVRADVRRAILERRTLLRRQSIVVPAPRALSAPRVVPAHQ